MSNQTISSQGKLVSGISLILLLAVGCAPSVQVRNVKTNKLMQRYANALTGDNLSERTRLWLRRRNFDRAYQLNPVEFLTQLESQIRKAPSREDLFALTELCYRTARQNEMMSKDTSLKFYFGATAYAYFYLFDHDEHDPTIAFDPAYRQACDLYNWSLAKIIKLSKPGKLLEQDRLVIRILDQDFEIQIDRKPSAWQAEEFGELLFASDYDVIGLENHYHNYGLGVPLIAKRKRLSADNPMEKHFPEAACFPVTAFLRMDGKMCDVSRSRKMRLELHDPLTTSELTVLGRKVPLEYDLTTPLGYYLSRANLDSVASFGLFRADKLDAQTGLYFAEPVQKGKIPVVLVHGLWSSPLTWMKMFNDLRADPVLRQKYQFWFFLYPTASPFLYSASRMRQALDQLLLEIDPKQEHPEFRQMVLVGHSMGGLLSKVSVQESSDRLWSIVANKSVDQLKGSEEEKQAIKQVYFFDPQPYVKRVVFIATPHQGSKLSKQLIGRVTDRLVMAPQRLIKLQLSLAENNGDAFSAMFRRGPVTSIDNLSPDSRILRAVYDLPISSKIEYHSIIGQNKPGPIQDGSDGVVPYASAHLEGAQSEIVVESNHNAHESPLAVNEVRRILLLHLEKVKQSEPVQPAKLLVETVEQK